MDHETKVALADAANLLIKSPNAHSLFTLINDCAHMLARHKELSLIGEASDLNILARMKVSRPDVYANIMRLVEQRREDYGYEKLDTEQEAEKFDRTQYMQEFMVQKRLRQRRAADIENLRRPERDRLIGRSRLDYMQRVSGEWKVQRDALLGKARVANGGRLSKEEMQAVLNQFWEKIDEQLDTDEDRAKSGGTKAHSVSLNELTAALTFDPYKK